MLNKRSFNSIFNYNLVSCKLGLFLKSIKTKDYFYENSKMIFLIYTHFIFKPISLGPFIKLETTKQ